MSLKAREILLGEVRGFVRGAELGVKAGATLEYLLEHCPDLELIGVDDWQTRPGYDAPDWHHDQYRNRAYQVARKYDRCTLIEASTVTAARQVEDESLDFVYIDADHSTAAVLADIGAWRRKIRPGGLLCGDDANKETVKKALNQVGEWKRIERVWLIPITC